MYCYRHPHLLKRVGGVDTDSGLGNCGTEMPRLAARGDIGKEDMHVLDVKHMILMSRSLWTIPLVHF